MGYTPRAIDAELNELLASVYFVVIEGPKAVGKTESAKQRAKTVIRLDVDENSRNLARIAPDSLLAGETPVLIDEWQLVPTIWSHVKVESDSRQKVGQFILTGSSVPQDDATRDTATGRVARLRMRPMSLLESGQSSGDISIGEMLKGVKPQVCHSTIIIPEIVDLICKGGWPLVQPLTVDAARKVMKAYIEEVAGIDLQMATGIKFNKSSVLRTLKSLARNVGTKVSISKIASDTGGEGNPVDRKTIADYLAALQRVMVTENNPPWVPNLRSPIRLQAASTRYFIDPSLAVAALGVTPKALLGGQLKLLGFLFENLVVRDLRVYLQVLGGTVKQYHDDSGDEIDVIIEAMDGSWAAIEIKLGLDNIDDAAKGLMKIQNKIDLNLSGEPAFMAVVTATGSAYVREDGIYVLPIGVLRP